MGGWPVTDPGTGVALDEALGDHLAELFTGVLLKEMACSGEDLVIQNCCPRGRPCFRIGPIAPVIGSWSLNATRNGLSEAASCCQAARWFRGWIIGRGGHAPRHRPHSRGEAPVREGRVVRGQHLKGGSVGPEQARLHQPGHAHRWRGP